MILYHLELPRYLERGEIPPAWLLVGEEDFLKEKAIKKVEETLLSPENKEFNYHPYQAGEVKPETVIVSLTTLPFLAEKRLVVVRGIEAWNEKEKETIAGYLRKPSPFASLLLTVKKTFRGDILEKEIQKVGVVVNFKISFEREVLSWIEKRFAEEGKRISSSGVQLLVELNGSRLSDLNNEIEKICFFSGERKDIDGDTILYVSTGMRDYQINDFLQGLFEGSKGEALKILEHLFTMGMDPFWILNRISQRIRDYICLSSGSGAPERLKIPRFVQERILRQAKQLDKRIFSKLLEHCLEAGFKIKTGQRTPQLALEELIIEIGTALESGTVRRA